MAFLVVLGLLDPDATAIADGGGLAITFLRPIEGGEHIARAWVEIADRAPSTMTFLERTVNGQPGLVARQDGVTLTVFAFHIAADRIKHIWVVRNRRNSVAGRRARGRQPAMPPSSVHFNGSVNLPDAETVMREISSRIPRGLRRMTDGETGERGYWIRFQIQKFEQMPEFERVAAGQAYETSPDAPDMARFRLADGASADTIHWPDLGYADAYAGSFEVFDRLQREGTIPADVRFQVQYPTPLASMAGTIAPGDMPAVAAAYESALFADLATLLGRIPPDRVAVQWDVAVEFGLLEGAMGPGAIPLEQIAPGLVRCVDVVPDGVPVGLHLCYGDYGHEHFTQPESVRMQVEVVNAVVAGARRTLNWASFTVPQARADAGYFAPLSVLAAAPETELYFALVPYHPDDQPAGTTASQAQHIDAALPDGREWGICTECGMGRVAAGDVPRLLDLYREILAA